MLHTCRNLTGWRMSLGPSRHQSGTAQLRQSEILLSQKDAHEQSLSQRDLPEGAVIQRHQWPKSLLRLLLALPSSPDFPYEQNLLLFPVKPLGLSWPCLSLSLSGSAGFGAGWG